MVGVQKTEPVLDSEWTLDKVCIKAKVFVTAEGDEIGIEEAYVYWVGLPGAFGIKVGKFRQEVGLYNRWHTHALWEVDRPLPYQVFYGEGLIQTGAGLTFPSLTLGPSTQTLIVEATAATNEVLFGEGGDMSFLGRFQSFFDKTSCRICLSSTRSATRPFSRLFSASNCFSRRISGTPSPP